MNPKSQTTFLMPNGRGSVSNSNSDWLIQMVLKDFILRISD